MLAGNCQRGKRVAGAARHVLGLPRALRQNRKQTAGTRDDWISLWNSKHGPISGRAGSDATGADSFINLERKGMRTVHMEVFPSPLNRVHMVALLPSGWPTSPGRAAALTALSSDGGI